MRKISFLTDSAKKKCISLFLLVSVSQFYGLRHEKFCINVSEFCVNQIHLWVANIQPPVGDAGNTGH